jgi:hypothetical protein
MPPDPPDGPKAIPPFKEYLDFVSPETWKLLHDENVSFRHGDKYEFRVIGKEIYDQLSNSPHIDRLREATGTIQLDVRIAFWNSETGIEYETLIVRTENGIEVVRRILL